jgi:hypothetical protein
MNEGHRGYDAFLLEKRANLRKYAKLRWRIGPVSGPFAWDTMNPIFPLAANTIGSLTDVYKRTCESFGCGVLRSYKLFWLLS